jgi:integrase/recombinase XerD
VRCAARVVDGIGCAWVVVPGWTPVRGVPEPVDLLCRAFAEHHRQHRGLTPRSILKQMRHAVAWQAFLHRRRRRLADAELRHIHTFVAVCAQCYARTTVADICSSLRAFLRFLHATERRRTDLASSMVAPAGPPRGAAAPSLALGRRPPSPWGR